MGRRKTKPRIHVVDDDPDVVTSLQFLLETEGFHVRTFSSGAALLRVARQGRVDCLVIDYKMPDIDGLDLVRRLRARKIDAPVVLITGYPHDGVELKAMASGVRHVVMKPHIDNSLMAQVRAAMRDAAAGRDLGEIP